MTIEQLSAYELMQKKEMPELNSTGYLLKHKKTKAKVALIENEDENKVFNVESAARDFKSYVKDNEDLLSADLVRSTS